MQNDYPHILSSVTTEPFPELCEHSVKDLWKLQYSGSTAKGRGRQTVPTFQCDSREQQEISAITSSYQMQDLLLSMSLFQVTFYQW